MDRTKGCRPFDIGSIPIPEINFFIINFIIKNNNNDSNITKVYKRIIQYHVII